MTHHSPSAATAAQVAPDLNTRIATLNAQIDRQEKIVDYVAAATLFVIGVVAGLVVACIAASAVLTNLPQ